MWCWCRHLRGWWSCGRRHTWYFAGAKVFAEVVELGKMIEGQRMSRSGCLRCRMAFGGKLGSRIFRWFASRGDQRLMLVDRGCFRTL